MNDKHTSGPWVLGCDLERVVTDYRDESGNSTSENYSRGGFAKSICRISHASFATIKEHVANGRLIATAPDGLALAELVIATATVETPSELINAAQALITKAST